MLTFFKKLFQMIFGKSDAPEDTGNTSTSPTQEPKKETKESPDPAGFQVAIKRSSYGKADTVGELLINGEVRAHTLEDPQGTCIPEGNYPLILRTEGGKHSTYWFRFKDMHKGMLSLEGADEATPPYLSIGNVVDEAKGCILLGTELKGQDVDAGREVWYSTQAYKAVYPILAQAIQGGEKIVLKISS